MLSLRERVAAFAQEQRAAAATASMGALAPDALAGEATGLQIEEILEDWKGGSRREFEAVLSQHVLAAVAVDDMRKTKQALQAKDLLRLCGFFSGGQQ